MGHEKTRIALTGGGTGGHLSPAVAVIEALQERSEIEVELVFIGSKHGAEARVIPLLGVPYRAISTGKLRRYISLENAVDMLRVPLGVLQSLIHLARFRPRAVFATGGYVSVPTVLAAALLHIPVVLHEQTGALGLANRINARFARVIALSVPGSQGAIHGARAVVTGNPLRTVVQGGNRERGARRFDLDATQPTVYVTGGAQGSHFINETMAAALPDLLETAQVIHQTGDAAATRPDYERLIQAALFLPEQLRKRYVVRQYIGDEIGDVYALADLVVSRSGAGTVNELAALGKPSVLVPLPHAAGDEQRANARRLADAGGAVVVEEADLTPERLVQLVGQLIADPARQHTMAAAARELGIPDATRRLTDLVLQTATGG